MVTCWRRLLELSAFGIFGLCFAVLLADLREPRARTASEDGGTP